MTNKLQDVAKFCKRKTVVDATDTTSTVNCDTDNDLQ